MDNKFYKTIMICFYTFLAIVIVNGLLPISIFFIKFSIIEQITGVIDIVVLLGGLCHIREIWS